MNSKLGIPLLLILVQACSHTPPSSAPAHTDPAGFHGIGLSLQERAHDGNFTLNPFDPTQKVDANSVLRLTFEVPPDLDELPQSTEWQLLQKALHEIGQLTAQYKELSRVAASLPATVTPQTQQWQQRVTRFDTQLLALERFFASPDMKQLIPDDINTLALRSVEENKSLNELRAEILMDKREQLHANAQQFAKDLTEYEVIVRAYLVPEIGDVQGLSIKGYNNLQSRPLRPINRLGFIPSKAEAQRLRTEFEGAQLVKTALLEIKNNHGEIKSQLSQLVKEAQQRLQTLAQQSQGIIDQWQQLLDDNTRQTLSESAQSNVKKLIDAVNRIQQDFDQIKAIKQEIDTLRAMFKGQDIIALIINLKENAETIDQLKIHIESVAKQIKNWPTQGNNIVNFASLAVEELLAEQKQALANKVKLFSDGVSQDFTAFKNTLEASLPETLTAVEFLSNQAFISQGEKLLKLSKSFNRDEPGAIPRPLDKLEPADVDLRRSGITSGDMVELDVGFFKKSDFTQPEQRIGYTARAILTDWHRRYSSDLIFVRPESGVGSDEYKPNVAVTLEWHYGTRKKSLGFFQSLDMGFGLHAANLDHDEDENIEVGAGVNFSFLDGLLRFGYGYNVSAEQNPNYYWFGFELFSMLNQNNRI